MIYYNKEDGYQQPKFSTQSNTFLTTDGQKTWTVCTWKVFLPSPTFIHEDGPYQAYPKNIAQTKKDSRGQTLTYSTVGFSGVEQLTKQD